MRALCNCEKSMRQERQGMNCCRAVASLEVVVRASGEFSRRECKAQSQHNDQPNEREHGRQNHSGQV